MYGSADQSHEFAFTPAGHAGVRAHSANVQFSGDARTGPLTVTVLPGSTGLITVWESDSQLVLFADPATTATFWAPPVRAATDDTVAGLENYWQFGTNTTVLVAGPYLVRNATIEGSTLALRGDLNASVPLTVIAPPAVKTVLWNGERVPTDFRKGAVAQGRLTEKLHAQGIVVPELTGWVFKDSLPEVQAGFDDSKWIVANKTSTNINQKPVFGDGRVLYGTCVAFSPQDIMLMWMSRMRLRLVSIHICVRLPCFY